MKILIVDDDQSLADIWAITFKKAGHEVFHALTGKDGIEQAKKQMPDFILLDQIMPDLRGNDVLRQLKADNETQAIPVALLSNYNETEMMNEAIQQGAIDYILKYQVEPEDLVSKIKTLTTGSHGTVTEENS